MIYTTFEQIEYGFVLLNINKKTLRYKSFSKNYIILDLAPEDRYSDNK